MKETRTEETKPEEKKGDDGNLPLRHVGNQNITRYILLTDTQKKVAHGVARGGSDKSIAADLGISPNTVSKHVGRVLQAFGFDSRVQIAIRYYEDMIAMLQSSIDDLCQEFRAHAQTPCESPVLD